jgi:hypothetical protein
MNTICGIKITQEHADAIRTTCSRIMREIEEREATTKATRFRYDFLTMQKTNPHNLFHGTPEEYVQKYPGVDR